MIPRGVAKRYATALFSAALKKDIASEIMGDVQGFRAVLSGSEPLRNFLLSPQVLLKNKKKMIDDTLKGRASQLFVDFLQLLIDKKRFMFIEEISDAYTYLYERHDGIIEAKVTTAVPIDRETEQRVIRKLEAETKNKIRLVTATDPEIIGGMIIVMEDKIIDGSVRFQMKKLKKELYEMRVE